jgi:vinculin
MVKLNEIMNGKGNKRDLLTTAISVAEDSFELCRIAQLLANDCTDKRMRLVNIQVMQLKYDV